MKLFEELIWRNLIYQSTSDNIDNILNKKFTLYIGIDPTGDSLHIGHLVPYLTAYRFIKAGHKVIFVVGKSTAMIGDPSGKNHERPLLLEKEIEKNTNALIIQIKKLFENEKYLLLNNFDWLKNINIIEFMRKFGKNINVSKMLSKELIKSRLEKGLSFTEFSYQLLQAIDFYTLYNKENCQLQIGGSDQWGNIVSGIELIKKINKNAEVYGITLPLIKKSDGSKFGKTSNGNIWIDKYKTNIFEFYQFWLNTDDQDVINYIKIFTFLDKEDIENIKIQMNKNPKDRAAQKTLAREITKFIHKEEGLKKAILLTEILFSKDLNTFKDELKNIKFKLGDGPIKILSKNEEYTILDIMLELRFCSSKTEGRKLLKSNSIKYNNNHVLDENFIVSKDKSFIENISIIKKGKKNFYILLFY